MYAYCDNQRRYKVPCSLYAPTRIGRKLLGIVAVSSISTHSIIPLTLYVPLKVWTSPSSKSNILLFEWIVYVFVKIWLGF